MIKYSIRCSLFPRGADTYPVRLRISWHNIRYDVRTGCFVEPDKWDSAAEQAKRNTSHGALNVSAQEINRTISDLRSRIEDYFADCDRNLGRAPTKEEMVAFVKAMQGKADSAKCDGSDPSLQDRLPEFVSEMGNRNEWTKATYKKFKTLHTHMDCFRKKWMFSDISESSLQSFIDSMHSEGLRNTSILTFYKALRWYLRWARNKGYHDSSAQDTFSPKLKGTDGNQKEVIYLEWEELMQFYGYGFKADEDRLAFVRDVFCFCSFTGLRWSDAHKLKKTDIKDGYMDVVTQKTMDGLRIELNEWAKAILDKYRNEDIPDGKALPVISNQKMNAYLKEATKMAGIDASQRVVYFKGNRRIEEVHPKWELMTTHCGRRTFVVNALRLGIPPAVIMQWTGHSDFKSMKPYVKIVDRQREEEMAKFNTAPGKAPGNSAN